MPDAEPFIFFSYAHLPRLPRSRGREADYWIYKLFDDLCEHIVNITDTDNPGFIDRGIGSGDPWRLELATALATCRVFVPLYSPRYFRSSQCGREWAAFARRTLDQSVKEAMAVDAIVPALWTSIERRSLPAITSGLQVNNLGDEDLYLKEGFYGIMKLRPYSSLYGRATFQLAREIVNAADRSQIRPCAPPRYESLVGAFGESAELRERPLRITVSALSNGERLPKGRTTKFYGPTAREWNPYHPTSKMPLAEYASRLVSCVGYEADVGTLEEHLAELLAGGVPTRPGLLVVDPWSTRKVERRRRLQQFDNSPRHCTGVVVPWSNEDHETLEADASLRRTMQVTLRQTIEGTPPTFNTATRGIPTIESFGDIATRMALTVGKEYLRLVSVGRLPGPRIERTRIAPPDPGGGIDT